MKKFLSLIVVALMLVSILPLAAFAANEEGTFSAEKSAVSTPENSAEVIVTASLTDSTKDGVEFDLTLTRTDAVAIGTPLAIPAFSNAATIYPVVSKNTSANYAFYFGDATTPATSYTVNFGVNEVSKVVKVKVLSDKVGDVEVFFTTHNNGTADEATVTFDDTEYMPVWECIDKGDSHSYDKGDKVARENAPRRGEWIKIGEDKSQKLNESYKDSDTVLGGKGKAVKLSFTASDDKTVYLACTDGNHEFANGVDAYELSATVLDALNAPVKGETVNFRVFDGSAKLSAATATTNDAGIAKIKVTSTKPGVVTIEAKVGDEKAYKNVEFYSTGAVSIKAVDDQNQKVARGTNKTFKFEAFDANGNKITNTTSLGDVTTAINNGNASVVAKPTNANFKDSSIEAVVVDGQIVVTLTSSMINKDGDYEFKVWLNNGSTASYKFSAKEVKEDDLKTMSLELASNNIGKGSYSSVLGATVKYSDAEGYSVEEDNLSTITFTTSDASVVSYDKATGLFKGEDYGTVTITAVSTAKEMTATATLTVVKAASSLKLTAPANISASEAVTIDIQVVDVDGKEVGTSPDVYALLSSAEGFFTTKPEDALVSYVDVDEDESYDFLNKGKAEAKFTPYVEGTYTLQVVIGSYTGSVTFTVGAAKGAAAGNCVFMIGATSYVSGGQAYAGTSVPFVDANNRTMLGFRDLGAALGATVSYADGVATLSKDGKVVTAKAGDKFLTVNGTQTAIDTEIVNVEGRLFLPLRAVSTAFGYTVSYSNGVITVK